MSTKTPAEKAAEAKASKAPKGSNRYKAEQKEIIMARKQRFQSGGDVSNNRMLNRDNPSFTMNGESMRQSGLDKIKEQRKNN